MDQMGTKTTKQDKTFASRDESRSDAELERFIADHHDEIEAKLQEARASIARDEVAPLEPLEVLLRDARRRH
jgi:hypothetical protein